jgi:hypothetical protein
LVVVGGAHASRGYERRRLRTHVTKRTRLVSEQPIEGDNMNMYYDVSSYCVVCQFSRGAMPQLGIAHHVRGVLGWRPGKRVILVCNLPPRPLMWKGARGVRGTNSSPRSPRLKPEKNVQNVPMDEDPLCSDGPIDIMLKPKPGLVPHFSCTFRPLQEAVLRHSPQGSPQNSPRLHPHSPRSRCDTPLCPSPTRSHSSMIPNAPLLIRPRAYAHRSRSRSWDDTRESRTAEAR